MVEWRYCGHSRKIAAEFKVGPKAVKIQSRVPECHFIDITARTPDTSSSYPSSLEFMGLPQESVMEDGTEVTAPFPAQTKQAVGEVAGIKTDVTSISFADKIMITITQGGRLAQWVRVPQLP